MNTVLIIASLEGHDEIMYMLIQATRGVQAIPFVFTIVALVSYFSLNLILAVIYDSYSAVVMQEKTKAKEKEKLAAAAAHAHENNHQAFLENGTKAEDGQESSNTPQSEKKPHILTLTRSISTGEGTADQSLSDVRDTSEAIRARELAEETKRSEDDCEDDRPLSWRETKKSRERLQAKSQHVTDSDEHSSATLDADGVEMKVLGFDFEPIEDNNGEEDAPVSCWQVQIGRVRDWCYDVVCSDGWFYLVYFCIILNFILLASEFHGMPEWYLEILEVCNKVLIVLFMVEMGMNWAGFGYQYFTHDSLNSFDAVIVLGSFIEAFFLKQSGSFNLSTVRSLRLFRVLRGLKALKHWDSMRQILKALIDTSAALGDFGLLLLLFVFTYALVGKASFGKAFNGENGFSEPFPRRNFDNIGQAMLSVFQVLTGEDWTNVLIDCMRVDWRLGSMYIISMYIFGGIILLSLFLAILIDNFSIEPDVEVSAVARRRHRVHPAGPLHYCGSHIYKFFKKYVSDRCKKTRSPKFQEWVKQNKISVNFDTVEDLEVSDEALKEYYMLFNHIDADKSSSVSKDEIGQYIEEFKFSPGHVNETAEKSNIRLSKLMEYMNTHSAHEGSDVEIDFRAFAYLMDQADVIFQEKFHRLSMEQHHSNGLLDAESLSHLIDDARSRLEKATHYGEGIHFGEHYHSDAGKGPDHRAVPEDSGGEVKASLESEEKPRSNESADESSKDKGDRALVAKDTTTRQSLVAKLLKQSAHTPEAKRLEAIYSDPLLRLQLDDLRLTFKLIWPHVHEGTNHRGHRVYTACCKGCEVVDALLNYGGCENVHNAVHIGQQMLDAKIIVAVSSRATDHTELDLKRNPLVFTDSEELFRAPDITPHIMSVLGQTKATKERQRAKAQRRRNAMIKVLNDKNSCRWFGGKNYLREFCMYLSTSPYFDSFILLLIFASMVVSSMNNPGVDIDSPKGRELKMADMILTGCFFLEMVIKMIAFGIIRNAQHGYLRDAWNVLDFVIVVISVLSDILTVLTAGSNETGFSAVTVVRGLRSLRALKAIKGSPGLRRVIRTVIGTIPVAADIAIFLAVVVMFFAAIGLNLYRGLFYSCEGDGEYDKYNLNKDECHGGFYDKDGIYVKRQWLNHLENFDNFGSSVLTLIEIGSLEQWPSIFNAALDVTELDKHPVKGNSPAKAVIFFVSFILLGSFIVFNLLIGAIITKFQESDTYGHLMLTEDQLSWIKIHKFILGSVPAEKRYVHVPPSKRPWWAPKWTWAEEEDSWMKVMAYDLVTKKPFNRFMIACVIINCAILSLSFYDEPEYWTQFMQQTNQYFCYIYVVEVIIKWYGLGIGQYFEYNSNIFDFALVVLCAVETGLSEDVFGPQVRLLRVARLGRLVNYSKTITAIVRVLVLSLPALVNVGSLLILILFIYGILGMSLFGNAPYDGEFITKHNNFNEIGWSVLTLARCFTGASWNGVMHALAESKGWAAYPFFVSFVFITSWVLLNLFVVIILDHFAHMSPASDTPSLHLLIHEFRDAWSTLNPSDPLFIDTFMLGALVRELGAPLGVPKGNNDKLREIHLELWDEIMNLTPSALISKSWKNKYSASLLSAESAHSQRAKGKEEMTRIVEFVTRLNLKETIEGHVEDGDGIDITAHHPIPPGKVFYLDILSALLVQCKGLMDFDASALFPFQYDEISSSMKQETGRSFRRAFRRLARTNLGDVTFGDLTNAALSVQNVWRSTVSVRVHERKRALVRDQAEFDAHVTLVTVTHKDIHESFIHHELGGLERRAESICNSLIGKGARLSVDEEEDGASSEDLQPIFKSIEHLSRQEQKRLSIDVMEKILKRYHGLKARWRTIEMLQPRYLDLPVVSEVQPPTSTLWPMPRSDCEASEGGSLIHDGIEARLVHLNFVAKTFYGYFTQQLERLSAEIHKAADPQKLGLTRYRFHLPFNDHEIFSVGDDGRRTTLEVAPLDDIASVRRKAARFEKEIASGEKPGKLLVIEGSEVEALPVSPADYILDFLRATLEVGDPYLVSVITYTLLRRRITPSLRLYKYNNAFVDKLLPLHRRSNLVLNVELLYPMDDMQFEESKIEGEFDEALAGRVLMVCELKIALKDLRTVERLIDDHHNKAQAHRPSMLAEFMKQL